MMSIFTSKRERALWLWALTVVIAIYSTLGIAGKLASALRDRNMLDNTFFFAFLLAILAIIISGSKKSPSRWEIWIMLGLIAVYGTLFLRLFITPEERTHLFEYGVVAILIYQALRERVRNGRGIPIHPAILAIAATIILGWLDEGIQAILPNRVYDIRDVGFNALAGLMAVVASVILERAAKQN